MHLYKASHMTSQGTTERYVPFNNANVEVAFCCFFPYSTWRGSGGHSTVLSQFSGSLGWELMPLDREQSVMNTEWCWRGESLAGGGKSQVPLYETLLYWAAFQRASPHLLLFLKLMLMKDWHWNMFNKPWLVKSRRCKNVDSLVLIHRHRRETQH